MLGRIVCASTHAIAKPSLIRRADLLGSLAFGRMPERGCPIFNTRPIQSLSVDTMNAHNILFVFVTTVAVLLTAVADVHAQLDSDVLILDVDGRLTSGSPNFSTNSWILGTRSYAEQFDSDFLITDPGWNTLGQGSSSLPAGAEALPADTGLEWDFLPMKIDGTVANLFYWDGNGTVEFGELPTPNYKVYLQAQSTEFIAADGSSALVPGGVIDETDEFGSLHRHRRWFLDDDDGSQVTDPVDGLYLVAVRTRMEGLDRSRPLFIVFGTLTSGLAVLDDAQQWVDENLDDLAADFGADFDGDLAVDAVDLTTWQTGYGLTGDAALQMAGDANFDETIGGADFLQWQREFGSTALGIAGASSASAVLAAIPEPGALVFVVVGCLVLASVRSDRSQVRPAESNRREIQP